jgi:hypothetical protein
MGYFEMYNLSVVNFSCLETRQRCDLFEHEEQRNTRVRHGKYWYMVGVQRDTGLRRRK